MPRLLSRLTLFCNICRVYAFDYMNVCCVCMWVARRKSTNISFDWKPGHLNANGNIFFFFCFFLLLSHLLTIWEFSLIIIEWARTNTAYRADCLLLPLIRLLLSQRCHFARLKTESNDLFSKPKTTDFCWLVLSTLLHRSHRESSDNICPQNSALRCFQYSNIPTTARPCKRMRVCIVHNFHIANNWMSRTSEWMEWIEMNSCERKVLQLMDYSMNVAFCIWIWIYLLGFLFFFERKNGKSLNFNGFCEVSPNRIEWHRFYNSFRLL